MLNKSCNGDYCQYKTLGGSIPGCSFDGYCDYQTPRDSRPITHWFPPVYGPSEPKCPYCHLPYSECRGHTICEGKDS